MTLSSIQLAAAEAPPLDARQPIPRQQRRARTNRTTALFFFIRAAKTLNPASMAHKPTTIMAMNMKLPENKRMTLVDSFKAADSILRQAILCISEVILTTGVINVDFADVVSIFRQSRSSDALLGIGESPTGRVVEAVQRAIESPLVERELNGAKGLVLNISGDQRLSLFDVSEAMDYVTEHTHPDVNIIFGVIQEPALGDTVRATLVATDFVDSADIYRTPKARPDQSAAGKRQPMMQRRPPVSMPQENNMAPEPEPQEAPAPMKNFDIQVPDFLANRRNAIPPLTMHDDDGTPIPPFQPKR